MLVFLYFAAWSYILTCLSSDDTDLSSQRTRRRERDISASSRRRRVRHSSPEWIDLEAEEEEVEEIGPNDRHART